MGSYTIAKWSRGRCHYFTIIIIIIAQRILSGEIASECIGRCVYHLYDSRME